MKKAILLAVCVFTATVTINAQEAPSKTENAPAPRTKPKMTIEQRAQKNVDGLNNTVTLTDEQKIKVKELEIIRITKVNEIRHNHSGKEENKEIAEKEIQAVKKEYHQGIKALLTPEQLEKMKAKNDEKKAEKELIPAEKH